MGKKDSFFSRLLNLFSSDKQIVQNTEPDRLLSDDISEDNLKERDYEQITQDTEDKLPSFDLDEVLEKSALLGNQVKYENQNYLVTQAIHNFFGLTIEYPDSNLIALFWGLFIDENKIATLHVTCKVPSSEEEILPGVYHFDENMFECQIVFMERKDGHFQEREEIEIVAGTMEIKKEQECFFITGDFQTIGNEQLTLYYEGEFYFRRPFSS